MAEALIASERKFEGLAWVGGFGPFPPPGPSAEVTLQMEAPAAKEEPTAIATCCRLRQEQNTALMPYCGWM